MRSERSEIRVVRHRSGAWGLRWRPRRLLQLQRLLDDHTFWAQGRTIPDLRRMLANSQVVVSAWDGTNLVGFGRANSDGLYRAVLWDVVVAGDRQSQGVGRLVLEALLNDPWLQKVRKIYLMTTNSSGFYERLGFRIEKEQQLLIKTNAQ